jgi:Transposase IS116/IS110/IS902 family
VAWAWLGEIGPAPHQWFAGHEKLASWVSLCPGNNISAKKRKRPPAVVRERNVPRVQMVGIS